jgi:lysozyme
MDKPATRDPDMKPASTPKATRANVISHARKAWKKARGNDPMPDFYMVGIRGYYFRTMGLPDRNDRGIYDDAIFLVGPETFAAFNANADPSRFRKGVATLLPGVHPYRRGNHGISRPGGGYPAFRPATKGEALPVSRDGEPGVSKRPGIAINIHRGSNTSTSSDGCQTIPPPQWPAFYAMAVKEMSAAKQTVFPYILIDGPIT